jgi:predicted amidophosphoribosyltransferase
VRSEWRDQLAMEGLAPVTAAASAVAGDEPPCPACGTAAPLVDGACSDCGLHLE